MEVVKESRIVVLIPAIATIPTIVVISEPLLTQLRIHLCSLRSIHSVAASLPIVAHVIALVVPIVTIPIPASLAVAPLLLSHRFLNLSNQFVVLVVSIVAMIVMWLGYRGMRDAQQSHNSGEFRQYLNSHTFS